MTNLETELQHLVSLMRDPYRDHWKAYVWAKAQYLAQQNPQEYAELPERLTRAMETGSQGSSASGNQ